MYNFCKQEMKEKNYMYMYMPICTLVWLNAQESGLSTIMYTEVMYTVNAHISHR